MCVQVVAAAPVVIMCDKMTIPIARPRSAATVNATNAVASVWARVAGIVAPTLAMAAIEMIDAARHRDDANDCHRHFHIPCTCSD
jgi:hypothetical protein